MKQSLSVRGPSVLDFAKLSINLYYNLKEDKERKFFSNHFNLKNKTNEYGLFEKTGFYAQVLSRKNYLNRPIIYLCGNSLVGILSKIILPQTGTHACAFNSPGDLE